MDDYLQIQTRRKSRSKTPFLRSSCDNEACVHAGEEGHMHERRKSPYVKKHPKVTAIIEESGEMSSPIQNKQENTTRQKSSAITTSDYSSNSSEDLSTEHTVAGLPSGSGLINIGRNKVITSSSSTTTVTTRTKNISNKINNINNYWDENYRNTTASSSRKNNNQYSSPINADKELSKEISQNEINAQFEKSKIKTSTPIYNSQYTKMNSKNNETTDIDSPAYQEYKDAGEYWAKFPKTDYTYSKLSPHRRELAPGIVGMPNMSRKSLEKHHERVSYMVERSPDQESYIRSRYEIKYPKLKQSKEHVNVNHLIYDSQDEVDLAQFDQAQSKTNSRHTEITSNHNLYSEQTWITKTMSFFVVMFNRFCNIFSRQNNLYETRIKEEERFGNVKSAFITIILSIFSYFYLLISSILYLDTLFLKSSAADNANKKRFFLLLLILLPLLLLAGAYYHNHPEEPFPPINFSQLSEKLPNVNLTQITQFVDYENIDQIKANTLEKIENLRAWSEDYFDYIKTVSYNVATETQKIFMENFSN